jgi:glycogen synthase
VYFGVKSKGTGFVTPTVDAAGLVDALHRAVRACRHRGRRQAIQGRGMAEDWSWTGPAARHLEIYDDIRDS